MSRAASENRPDNARDDERAKSNGGARDEQMRRPEKPGQNGPDRDSKEDKGGPQQEDQQNKDEKDENKPPIYKRPIFWIVVGVIVVAGIIWWLLWWFDLRFRITTDDAFITAHNTLVSPRVSGHVMKVLVDDNQDVKRGDLLVELDDKDFVQAAKSAQASYEIAQAQLAQANATLASSKASVAQAQADVVAAEAAAKQAESDKQRYHNVQKTDPRAVSQQQVDQADATARTTAAQLAAARQKQGAAEAQVKVAEAQIVSAQASIDKARSDVDNAQLQLSYTKIHAAEDGRVTNRGVEVGNYITPGQALMALVPREVWVIANYKETQLRNLREGQPVKIHIDAYDLDLEGHVQSIQAGSGAAFSLLPPENATGNYVKVVQRVPVKITFDQPPDRRLAPGMSVEPTVETKNSGGRGRGD